MTARCHQRNSVFSTSIDLFVVFLWKYSSNDSVLGRFTCEYCDVFINLIENCNYTNIECVCILFPQIILVYCMTGINSQFGPPPRLTITGASQSQVRQPIQYTHRNERLVSSGVPNGGFLRSRRPVLATPQRPNTLQPFQTPNSLNEDPKPVTEENESAETPSYIPQQSYVPQIQQIQPLQHIQQQQQFKQNLPSVLYTTDENGEVLEHHRPLIDFSTTPRLLQQPNPAEIVPTTIRTTHNVGNGQRFFLNQDRPVQSALLGTTKPPVSLNE